MRTGAGWRGASLRWVMITKLPRWVWAGGWALAFVAGIVNVVGLLGFGHQAITHLTGTTSLLGAAVAALDGAAVAHFAAVMGSFVAGAVLSGFIIRDSTLKLGRRYVWRCCWNRCCCASPFAAQTEQHAGNLFRVLRVRAAERDGQHLQRRGGAHDTPLRHVHRPRHFPGTIVARAGIRPTPAVALLADYLGVSVRGSCRWGGLPVLRVCDAIVSQRADGAHGAGVRLVSAATPRASVKTNCTVCGGHGASAQMLRADRLQRKLPPEPMLGGAI